MNCPLDREAYGMTTNEKGAIDFLPSSGQGLEIPGQGSRWSLRTSLFFILLLVCLPICALITYDLFKEYYREHDHASKFARYAAHTIADQVSDILDSNDRAADVLSKRPKVRLLDAADCDPMVDILLAERRRIVNVLVVAGDGRVICSAVEVGHHFPHFKEWLQLVKQYGKSVLSQPSPGALTGNWVVHIVHPVHDKSGQIVGAAAIGLNFEALDFSTRGMTMPNGTTVTMVTSEGVVFSRSTDGEQIGRAHV